MRPSSSARASASAFTSALARWLLPDLRAELSVRVMWSPYEEIDIATVGHDPTRTALGAAYAALGPVVSNPGRFIDRDG